MNTREEALSRADDILSAGLVRPREKLAAHIENCHYHGLFVKKVLMDMGADPKCSNAIAILDGYFIFPEPTQPELLERFPSQVRDAFWQMSAPAEDMTEEALMKRTLEILNGLYQRARAGEDKACLNEAQVFGYTRAEWEKAYHAGESLPKDVVDAWPSILDKPRGSAVRGQISTEAARSVISDPEYQKEQREENLRRSAMAEKACMKPRAKWTAEVLASGITVWTRES